MRLFGTMNIDSEGHLHIGDMNTVDLAKEFGTPLYVVDEKLLRDNCKEYRENFSLEGMNTEVIYASKAFLNIAMCKLIKEEGLSLDVVSGGELYTALKAGFPVDRLYMHGNNKSVGELTIAIESGIGRIVVDNSFEIELIEELCEEREKNIEVLLRVNPGIEAHTHEYIKTTSNDSKFGVSTYGGEVYKIIENLQNSKWIKLKGFHCHIGSQIFQEESFFQGAEAMLDFILEVKDSCDFITEELNLGGGFGVYYIEGDEPIELGIFLKNQLRLIKEKAEKLNIKTPKIMIEPGRSIIANAGTTLYKVGSIKETFGGKKYVFVDGGMNDNPRTSLYGAEYEAAVASKMLCEKKSKFTISGKCCESGDMIVKDVELCTPERGDIVAVFSTGAYNYSMSSNYNRLKRPAVVFVKDGEGRVVVKRETYEDLIRNDIQ